MAARYGCADWSNRPAGTRASGAGDPHKTHVGAFDASHARAREAGLTGPTNAPGLAQAFGARRGIHSGRAGNAGVIRPALTSEGLQKDNARVDFESLWSGDPNQNIV
jgi:hypothetical protein